MTVFGGGSALAFGQTVYTVFPARPPEARAQGAQPTKRSAAVLVTLVVRDSTIAYAVNEVARQAKLRAVYSNSNPLFAKRIRVSVSGLSPTDAFTAVLSGTGLVAQMTPDGETVVIRSSSKGGDAGHVKSGTVTGRVTDSASGKGIGGATSS